MKTDSLFYELFRIDPRSLFELVQLDIEGDYTFESITAKRAEKRFDGFLRRMDGDGPFVFLEIQGYTDKKIYWRLFREICTWYEQEETDIPFAAVLLFLDEKYDPGDCPLSCLSPHRMIRANLTDCLKSLGDRAGVLTVLKPFGISAKEELPGAVSRWKKEIDTLNLPEYKTERLTELLEYVILQCFPKLTLKEIKKMIHLTPLEETVAGQELIQIGIERGLQKGIAEGIQKGIAEGMDRGIEKGEIIGKIQIIRKILKQRQSPKANLIGKKTEELKEMLRKLEEKL